MKVKALVRSEEQYTKSRSGDVLKVQRNLDPALHPMARAVEYKRAMNAVKLERVFAKPLVGALEGHSDGVTCIANSFYRMNQMITAAADGEIRVWDVEQQVTLRKLVGHQGAVTGVTVAKHGDACVSCGADSTVRLWRMEEARAGEAAASRDGVAAQQAAQVYEGKHGFRGVDHHHKLNMFVTAGPLVELWDHKRSEPINSFSWGADSATSVRFNPAEVHVFATSGTDRSIALYDTRTGTPTRKLIMQNKTNAMCWNPQEPLNFTVANEDCNLYSYDMRKLTMATCVHEDFVSAVMDIDYAPTGREFVAGSYDRTVRIFGHAAGHSREVYHTKRMQRVSCVKFSADAGYVFSGSDDMNIRIWKAHASQQLGTMLPREKRKAAYSQALVQRYHHVPEVKRIERHRHVPKAIVKAHKTRRTVIEAEGARQKARVAHSKPGQIKNVPARKKKVVNVLE
mmetsp:Transcript_25659/g.48639  ORF Transcript_25659/g.48639 Transcript_25659/m.48639 type:complete len:455 (-) Transcript_25659:141-1505(-)|eukprot:CAMPEP_0114239376 /NCGR_PEP_ID=MMETSP0058-20121206/8426_1 /TAXON_ID=36894 /ORGANISM="Pyramimonas parkeae, CCMP726" /LENGTH=454 /DNA_ID=CAMNT_0001351551 /DNA_START=271 /DNA_END=1635 /DNA_ORIENTATION=+